MKRLLLLSLLSLYSSGMQVSSDILRKGSSFADAKLIYDKEHFIVDENGQQKIVQRYNISRDLRSLSDNQVKSLLNNKSALLYLRKLSDNSYALQLEGKLKGGTGPFTAWVAGTVVKAACWAGVMLGSSLIYKGSERAMHGDRTAAAGTSVIAVGGGIGAAGGFPALAAGIESIGNAVAVATLAIPIPLP